LFQKALVEHTEDQVEPQENGPVISVSTPFLEKEMTCDGEPYLFSFKRWMKIAGDFKKETKQSTTYDISKLHDIMDNINFDVLHNPELTNEDRISLLNHISILGRVVTPLEYGMTAHEKIEVGR
jgi:inositol hexakisphosphate/diphosphoinositol-pentakisphosphate kinase